MDEHTRKLIIEKLGILMLANTELASVRDLLTVEVNALRKQLADIKTAQPSLPLNDLPPNPYELPPANGAAH